MKFPNEMEPKLDAIFSHLKKREIAPSTMAAMRPHLTTLKEGLNGEPPIPSSKAAIIFRPEDELPRTSSTWKWETGIGVAALILIWMSLELSRPVSQLVAHTIDRVINASGFSISLDIQNHRSSSLSTEEESFRMESIEKMATQPFLKSRFPLLKNLESTPLGKKVEGGVLLSGFKIRHQDIDYEIWAEQDSSEPFELKLHGTFEHGPTWTITLNQFVFDPDGSAVSTRGTSGFGDSFRQVTSGNIVMGENGSGGVSGFAMGSTDGASHITATQVVAHQGTFDPKALARSLEFILSQNQGRFPETLEPSAFVASFMNTHQLTSPLSAEEQGQLDQALEKAAIAFSAPNRLRSRAWHYEGKGLHFGERKKVCWWQEETDGPYTIILGDLSIETKLEKP